MSGGLYQIHVKCTYILSPGAYNSRFTFQLEDVRAVIESEESSAGMIEPDLVMLEENQKSLKSLDKDISLLQAKVEGVGEGFSGKQVK